MALLNCNWEKLKITYVNCGLINACESDLGSDEHYLSCSGNIARENSELNRS